MSDPKDLRPGVSEEAAAFRSSDDDWAIARERYEDYLRTGETISVDEFFDELRRDLAERHARKAGKA